jgi:hypothetical protein
MTNIKIYVLTHKKFNHDADPLYEPLLNGSALFDEDFGYTRDDTGDNISLQNPYYSELTGQYWAWKNSNVDIIGFCHYRRYFVKTIFLKKIEKQDISKWLKEYDIILPQKKHTSYSNIDEIKFVSLRGTTCEKVDDYVLLREIIEEKSPEYLDCYDEFLNDNEIHYFNMFICKKQLADDYFNWLFDILKEFKHRNDFSVYDEGNMRVLGYLSERLLNVYVRYHDLKVKEQIVINYDAICPPLIVVENRSPFIQKVVKFLIKLKVNNFF